MHNVGVPDLKAHLAALTAVALILTGAVLAVVNRDSGLLDSVDGPNTLHVWGQLILGVMFAAAGWLLATRRPEVVFGWLALAAAIGHGLSGAGTGWAVFSLTSGLPGAGPALWAATFGEPLETFVLVVTWATFPHGRLPRGGVRWPAAASVVLCAAGWSYGLFSAWQVLPGSDLNNPLAIDGLPSWVPVPLFTGGLFLGSVVMVVRWLRAEGRERQVLRWLAVVNAAGILLTPVIYALPAGDLLSGVGVMIILVVITAVVLSNQIYGIDMVLNRTLVYVLLTALVAGVYAAGIAILALLGQAVGGPWTVIAALGAAFSLAPARAWIQRLVNRFLYGERDEPYKVIARLAARLESAGSVQQLLPDLLEAVTGALRLPSAAVEMIGEDGSVRRIAHGDPRADVRFPLAHQGRDIGALVVGLRSGQSALDLRETRLMEDIARQVAVAASHVMLTEALILSRERIVNAAEEERRRLRHDLHDGLGPTLTAAATKVDATRNLLDKNPPKARDLLDKVRHDLTTALGDLRRLVYALRPPVLDELGLLGALREHLQHTVLPVTLSSPATLPVLPAAVEIAAYRIITEAVTNVTRHASATGCQVTIVCTGQLTLEIHDNGPGDQRWSPGVGLASMRERATALGGTWRAGPTATGGRVFVELPLSLAGSGA